MHKSVNCILCVSIVSVDCFSVSKESYEDCDCICIFILTHGTNGDYVYAKDYRYRLSDIWEKFTADNCETLAGKPKLFFIQVSNLIRF